jgi:hypothetical protein
MLSFQFWTACSLVGLAALISPIKADETQNPDLVAKLKAAGSQLDRLKLLPNDDTDWTFDFTAQKKYSFDPASVVNANSASFPVCLTTISLLCINPPLLFFPQSNTNSRLDRCGQQIDNGHDPTWPVWDVAAALPPKSI